MSDPRACSCDSESIMVEVRDVYDGGLFFECSTCRARWHRWGPGTWQRAEAERVWAAWDALKEDMA